MEHSVLMTTGTRWARALLLVAIGLQAGCTTMQTTYFRSSYQPLEVESHPAFAPYSGESQFREVSDMGQGAADMYNEGYAILGYSQFISPLYTSLAPGYATKYAKTLGADYVVMQTPRPGASNLHSYLVTYWRGVNRDVMTLGTYAQGLPDDLLARLGEEFNVVHLRGVVPGTAAAKAGLKRDDVILAINGVRVESLRSFNDMMRRGEGEEVVVSVSRYGKPLDLVVDLENVAETRNSLSYREAPWRLTEPKDWSMLSAANVVANYQQQQIEEQRRQAAYEQGRLAAMEARAGLTSDVDMAYIRANSRSDGRSGRRKTSYTRTDWQRGLRSPSASQWSMEYGSFLDNFSGLTGDPNALDSTDIWFKHAPNIYGQLFTFPRPQVY